MFSTKFNRMRAVAVAALAGVSGSVFAAVPAAVQTAIDDSVATGTDLITAISLGMLLLALLVRAYGKAGAR